MRSDFVTIEEIPGQPKRLARNGCTTDEERKKNTYVLVSAELNYVYILFLRKQEHPMDFIT